MSTLTTVHSNLVYKAWTWWHVQIDERSYVVVCNALNAVPLAVVLLVVLLTGVSNALRTLEEQSLIH
jgi:hypothetical protein